MRLRFEFLVLRLLLAILAAVLVPSMTETFIKWERMVDKYIADWIPAEAKEE